MVGEATTYSEGARAKKVIEIEEGRVAGVGIGVGEVSVDGVILAMEREENTLQKLVNRVMRWIDTFTLENLIEVGVEVAKQQNATDLCGAPPKMVGNHGFKPRGVEKDVAAELKSTID